MSIGTQQLLAANHQQREESKDQLQLQPFFNAEQIQIIKNTIAPEACTDDELQLFLIQCQRTRLDPFSRQIYCMKSKGKLTIQSTIDGFRVVAERNPSYAGQDGPYWCGADGVWRDVWLSDEPPKAAKVGIYRHGFAKPIYAVARFESFVQTYADYKTGEVKRSGNWNKMPDHMLGVRAECQALRRAFPNDLSGIYSTEEMEAVENVEVIEPGKKHSRILSQNPSPTTTGSAQQETENSSETVPSKLATGAQVRELIEYAATFGYSASATKSLLLSTFFNRGLSESDFSNTLTEDMVIETKVLLFQLDEQQKTPRHVAHTEETKDENDIVDLDSQFMHELSDPSG